MSRRATRAVVCATLVALIAGSTSAAFGATPVDELIAPVPIDSPTGAYVVVLEEPAAASYGGGVSGLGSTTPGEGKTFDPHSSRVQKYVEYLEERQREVAAASGVEPLATYQVTLNGFSAKLAPDAAARVAAMDGVLAVYPERILRPDAVPPTDDPRLAPADQGQRGRAVDGADDGGAGVIVGIIDTGIAPENPSFAGARLRSTPSGQPYLEGNEVVFRKADGTEFRSTRVTGEEWTKRDYSTTVIGAQQFTAGATAGGFSFDHDVLSPRDSGGHGSLTAGIAAGRSGVDATVDGTAVSSLSGVAPGAKIAAYKACVAGADPLVTTDDSCAGSDVLSAIERAVADGVDVIGYSIGGASDASAWGPEDMALYNAAVAGVFIAASAGNAGPAASSVGLRGAPWYTTVAASTLAAHAATVRLSSGFDAIGVSISVSQDTPVTAPVVYAGDTPLAGSTDANLCYPGTIDPAAVKGRIVICDRGINSSTEKSEAVADAGGVGMILANVSPGSLDAEAHAVPTVHIDATDRSALREELANESGATATLVGANVTDIATAAPQVAAFSSRGPTLAAGGGILTPDVLAPGVAIAGATQSTSTGEPTWGIASGTSMAAAHVAGLAARYIGAHPTASSDEVKSAIMTTAHNAVRADGSADVDPFAQGAGHVDAARLLDPGLVYLSGPDEWAAYAESLAAGETGESGVGDLNLPSIAIDALTHEQTISRTVTATRPGTYRVAVSIAGVDVSVSPEVLTFAASGDTHQFEATFTNSTAPVGVWSTGYLTWASDDGTSVRSPLAVRPATADAPGMVTGDGITGTAEVEITAGVTGAIEVEVAGLAPVELLVDPASAATGHSGDAHSGDENGNVAWSLDIPDGSPLAQFTLAASDDSALDLAVYRRVGTTGTHYDRRWG
ncbi:MAG TPA: S8 family serine peptidase, partial [Microbacterium sp.]|nr:S8 family serine peptidase [Microbacterium sp.]